MRLQTDSIIFDLDGTLWDASATCTEAWNESLRELGMLSFSISQEAIQSFSGLRVEHVLSQHFSFIPHADHARLLDVYKKNEAELMKRFGGALYPDVRQVVQKISG